MSRRLAGGFGETSGRAINDLVVSYGDGRRLPEVSPIPYTRARAHTRTHTCARSDSENLLLPPAISLFSLSDSELAGRRSARNLLPTSCRPPAADQNGLWRCPGIQPDPYPTVPCSLTEETDHAEANQEAAVPSIAAAAGGTGLRRDCCELRRPRGHARDGFVASEVETAISVRTMNPYPSCG